MYRIGVLYKLELKKKIFYTGRILEEDNLFIRFKTIRDEDLIINKSEIAEARVMDEVRESKSIEVKNENNNQDR